MKLKLRDHTYIDWRVYSIIKIKGKYGFRVKLIYGVDDKEIKQHAGFRTKKEADDKRNDVITQLKNHTYVVYPRVKVADFYEYWLDKLEKSDIAYNTYMSYRNAVSNYIVKKYGKILMTTLNMGHIQKLYNTVSQEHESVVRIVKTVMNISLEFAKRNNIVSVNVALNVNLPKTVKKKPYRKLNIDVSKTLTIEQAKALINESKNTPIYLQILFAILMGFRISEINSLRYDDVDFINRKLDLKEQLGRTKESSDKYKKKTVTKQRIKLKTKSSMRQNEIPDLLFEAILELTPLDEETVIKLMENDTVNMYLTDIVNSIYDYNLTGDEGYKYTGDRIYEIVDENIDSVLREIDYPFSISDREEVFDYMDTHMDYIIDTIYSVDIGGYVPE